MTASLTAYRELLEDKLKNHHRNIGTLGSKEALEERKRVCVAQGLLQSRYQHLVRNVFKALPSAEELGESSVSDRVGHKEDSTQDEASGNKTAHAVVLQTPASGDQKFSDKGLVVVVEEDNDDDDIFINQVPSWQISHTAFEKTRKDKANSQFYGKRPRSESGQARKSKKVCNNTILRYFSSQQLPCAYSAATERTLLL